MENLIISMESICDFSKDLIKKYDFSVLDMDFIIGEEVYNTRTDDIVSTRLYERMEKNEKTSTSQINAETYKEFFLSLLGKSKKILHLAFSSGLSNTYISAVDAAKAVTDKYGADISVVASLGGGAAHGMLGNLVQRFAQSTNDFDEVKKYASKIRYNMQMLFTVDNLKYLVSGGRIKPSVAFVGNLLNIKPLVKVNNEGKLVSFAKVISRRKSIKSIFDIFMSKRDADCDLCFISHANCERDASILKDMIEKETSLQVCLTNLGPVLGCHAGPGTIAIFYAGNER